MKKHIFRLFTLILVFCLAAGFAAAETVRGDLTERFSDVPRIEHNGTTYRLRNRLTTVLAMGIGMDENGAKRVDLALVLVVDDDAKRISAIEIPPNTLVQVPGEADGETWNMRFGDVYMLEEDPDAACLRMVDTVNALLGQPLVEHYMAFDVEGVKVIDPAIADGSTKQQLKAMKQQVDAMPADELSGLYAELGDYIITDLKSGAAMKIADKMERYDVPGDVDLPGEPVDAGEHGEVFVHDAGGLTEIIVSVFFEEENL